MFELGNSFKYLQRNSLGVIFDMNNQIVFYDASQNHINKDSLVIFKRQTENYDSNFDFADKIFDIKDNNSDIAYQFYKLITDKSLKEIIRSNNKHISKFEIIQKNWLKMYDKESFKENLFKSLDFNIKYHNFQKYLKNYSFEKKSHFQWKFMGDSYSTTYVKGIINDVEEKSNTTKYKNNDKFSDTYIIELLKFSLLIDDDRYDHSKFAEIYEKFSSDEKVIEEQKKFLSNAINSYNAETHIKIILQKKGLYDLELDNFPKIKIDLDFYCKSLIDSLVIKLNIINDKKKLLQEFT